MLPEKAYPYSLRAVSERYFNVSFGLTAILIAWFLIQGEFWANGMFLGLMFVGNLWFLPIFTKTFFYPKATWWFFLGQVICLMGTGIMAANPLFFCLAAIPLNFAYYNFFSAETVQEGALRRWPLFAALAVMLAVAWWQHTVAIDATTGLLLAVLILWAVLPAWPLTWRQGKVHLVTDKSPHLGRLFFHDMMNQVHGMSLFLNQKLVAHQSLSGEEVNAVLGEVKLMQAMLQEYFGTSAVHSADKNVPFTLLQENVVRLIETYLPPHIFQTKISFLGGLATDSAAFVGDKIGFPPTSFFRIITNLAKNMAEHNSDRASFSFEYNDEGLIITAQNHLKSLWEASDVAQELGDIILQEDQLLAAETAANPGPIMDGVGRPGLGLESVTRLCESLGGQFTFGRQGEFWLAKIFIPAAKILAHPPRAA